MDMDIKDTRKLIEHITAEVLKKINFHSEAENKSFKTKILAVSFSNREIFEALDCNKFEVEYGEDSLENLFIEKYEAIFVGKLGTDDLARVALGIGGNPLSQLLIKALLKYKEIFIIEDKLEYRSYEKTANTSFYKMLQGYEEKLKEFGIRFIESMEIEAILNKQDEATSFESTKASRENQSSYHLQGKIITEAIAKHVCFQGYKKIEFSKNTIITPLAQDYFKTNAVTLIRR